MSDERREFLHPWVPPWAAVFIARDYCDQLEAKGRAFLAKPGMEPVGRELMIAVRQLREAGRVRLEAHRATSEVGSSEVPIDGRAPSSEGVLLAGQILGSGQVAEKLRVSPRRVVQMIDEEKLSATKQGGRWLIEEASVVAWLENGGR